MPTISRLQKKESTMNLEYFLNKQPMSKPEKIYVRSMGKKLCVGYIKGDTFHKVVNINKHLFRKANAWGIDYRILKERLMGTVKVINVTESVYRTEYWTTPGIWFNKGLKKDFGHSLQVFLPIREFAHSHKELKLQNSQPELFPI